MVVVSTGCAIAVDHAFNCMGFWILWQGDKALSVILILVHAVIRSHKYIQAKINYVFLNQIIDCEVGEIICLVGSVCPTISTLMFEAPWYMMHNAGRWCTTVMHDSSNVLIPIPIPGLLQFRSKCLIPIPIPVKSESESCITDCTIQVDGAQCSSVPLMWCTKYVPQTQTDRQIDATKCIIF